MFRSLLLLVCALAASAQQFRPPAVPLATSDPYFSIWSTSDQLYADETRHWTGTVHSLASLLRVDGKVYRVMGNDPESAPVLTQKSLTVLPTRSIYTFEGAGVRLTLTFLSPLLPHDLDVLSRPVTYITWDVQSIDGGSHSAAVYFDAGVGIARNSNDQPVEWGRFRLGQATVLRVGTREQPMLKKAGDDLRIDWGHLYVTAPEGTQAIALREDAQKAFATGSLPDEDDLRVNYTSRFRTPELVWSFDLGTVASAPVSRHLLLAYDDLYSMEFLDRRVRPYWRRNGATATDLLRMAERDYVSLNKRAAEFDSELMADMKRLGGEHYAQLCALSYRQAIAAHKLAVDADGSLLFFSKENFSNGCINTVDVFYPSAPLFLLMNTNLLRGSVEPLLKYASLPRWRWPFAPHDLGTYPLANGQVYGGGERTEEDQMPVEESGNMLLLVAAIARAEGNASLADKYWPLMSKWAAFLTEKGLDPENQLCTDDFAGHLARNANLSLKAIEALGGYAMLCEMTGRKGEAVKARKVAQDYAKKWLSMAADGDHTVLAFGQPGTWSQKYNLVWDRILGLNLFPADVARKEIAYYKGKQNKYGVPLDNRAAYTKIDWLLWTATLADNQADFQSIAEPAWVFANETGSRVPLTDWYMTTTGKQQGFQARSVVGGLFIKMLADEATWKKWRAGK